MNILEEKLEDPVGIPGITGYVSECRKNWGPQGSKGVSGSVGTNCGPGWLYINPTDYKVDIHGNSLNKHQLRKLKKKTYSYRKYDNQPKYP